MSSKRFSAAFNVSSFFAKCSRMRWFTGSRKKLEPGHRAYAHLPGQHFAEFQVAVVAELGDVQQDVVGALEELVWEMPMASRPSRNNSFLCGVLVLQSHS